MRQLRALHKTHTRGPYELLVEQANTHGIKTRGVDAGGTRSTLEKSLREIRTPSALKSRARQVSRRKSLVVE